jgi:hypothetical protein
MILKDWHAQVNFGDNSTHLLKMMFNLLKDKVLTLFRGCFHLKTVFTCFKAYIDIIETIWEQFKVFEVLNFKCTLPASK